MTYKPQQLRRRVLDRDVVELVARVVYQSLPGEGSKWSSLHEDTADEWRDVAEKVVQELYVHGLLRHP